MSNPSQGEPGDQGRREKRPLRDSSMSSTDSRKREPKKSKSPSEKEPSSSLGGTLLRGRSSSLRDQPKQGPGLQVLDIPMQTFGTQSRPTSRASQRPGSNLRPKSESRAASRGSTAESDRMSDGREDESNDRIDLLKTWINGEHPCDSEKEMEFLDNPAFTPEELSVAMFYAHRQASSAVEANIRLHREAMAPFTSTIDLEYYVDDARADTNSRYVMPVNTVSLLFENPHLHQDSRFKRTIAVLACILNNAKNDNKDLEEDAENLQRLRRWINDPERGEYKEGEGCEYLKQNPDFTTRIEIEAVIYAKQRCSHKAAEYARLADIVRSHCSGSKRMTKTWDDLIRVPKPPMLNFWQYDNQELRMFDNQLIPENVEEAKLFWKHFEKSFALLCKTVHQIDEDVFNLKKMIEETKTFEGLSRSIEESTSMGSP